MCPDINPDGVPLRGEGTGVRGVGIDDVLKNRLGTDIVYGDSKEVGGVGAAAAAAAVDDEEGEALVVVWWVVVVW